MNCYGLRALLAKKQVLFVHSGGDQGEHQGSSDLVAHLQQSLGNAYDVMYPQMPDPEQPVYEDWKDQLDYEFEVLNNEIILVGHSLGGSVLLKYLTEQTMKKTIAGLFMVAAPYWGLKNWRVNEYRLPKNFTTKLPRIPYIYLYHSQTDEVVPFAHGEQYARKLPGAVLHTYTGGDHLFSNGLPDLAEDIRKLPLSINRSP